jgi:hypothetical protein
MRCSLKEVFSNIEVDRDYSCIWGEIALHEVETMGFTGDNYLACIMCEGTPRAAVDRHCTLYKNHLF